MKLNNTQIVSIASLAAVIVLVFIVGAIMRNCSGGSNPETEEKEKTEKVEKKESKKSDKVIIASNIEFTMPIYNPIAYQYFFNHLEAEYSLPFLEMLLANAQNNKIKTYEMPSSSTSFNEIEVLKRLEHQERETIVEEDSLGNVIEKDTVIKKKYSCQEIDYFRFGQQWIFDLESLTFSKQINYFAPIIRLTSSNGEFRGFYRLFYIRKD
jgi:hypothetical protein